MKGNKKEMTHLQRLKNEMKKRGIGAVIVTSEINQRYLTGFNYTDGLVVVTADRAALLTDFRYIEAANVSPAVAEFEILMPEKRMSAAALDIIGGASCVAVEEATLSLSAYEGFVRAFEGIEVKGGASEMLDGLREFKDAEEIEKMRRAQAITDAAFAHIVDFIRPDMTEREVALELEFFMRSKGAESVAFETIAVSGSASSMPHGVPRDVKLERGFLTMDFGARFDGYCSDMTRTVVIGRADAEIRRLYETVLRAQTEAIAAAAPGAGCAQMDKIARDIIDGAGYVGTFGHSLGHGVGMYIHEEPRLSARVPADKLLTPGQVVTFEPGIYLSGKYGCRIEDMVAITEDGIMDFTQSPKELIEIC